MFMTNSSDIGLTCDVCGRTVLGATFMNGMKFCAKCYQETFGSGQPYKTVERMWGDMYLELLKEHRELEQENKTKDERIAELERNQNQKAIECLKEVKYFINPKNTELSVITRNNFANYIDNKIKELENE